MSERTLGDDNAKAIVDAAFTKYEGSNSVAIVAFMTGAAFGFRLGASNVAGGGSLPIPTALLAGSAVDDD